MWVAKKHEQLLKGGEKARNLSALPYPIRSLICNLRTLPVAFPSPALEIFKRMTFEKRLRECGLVNVEKGWERGRVFSLSSTS